MTFNDKQVSALKKLADGKFKKVEGKVKRMRKKVFKDIVLAEMELTKLTEENLDIVTNEEVTNY